MRTDERVVSPEDVVGRHEGHGVFAKLNGGGTYKVRNQRTLG
jgi:hypothetical protein